MDKSIPAGAAILLDFIAGFESRGKYEVIYGNHEGQLATPITRLTLAELLTKQQLWGKMWGSSAAGRYQIMPSTLKSLMIDLDLNNSDVFSPDMQDRLAYQLLKRRGFLQFMSGNTNMSEFGKALAEEWASLPVLANTKGAHIAVARGQSYYESDGLNHALIDPTTVEQVLVKVQATKLQPGWIAPTPPPKPVHPAAIPAVVVATAGAAAYHFGVPAVNVVMGLATITIVLVVGYSVLKGRTKWF